MYYGCGFTQDFTPAVDFTEVPWRTDLLLPQPQLLYPRPDSVVCLNSTPGAGSNIFLEWKAVAGASHYLVQWANNQQLSGPTIREALIAAPTTVYELITENDIRVGETIYWRVIAVNRTTGGASAKSQQRKLTFNCNTNQTGYGLDRCTDYDVQMRIGGQEYLSCCDEGVYWLELSYDCKDQFDRTLVEVHEIEWSVQSNPGGGDTAHIKSTLANDYRAIVEACGEESQVIKICVTVTFLDHVLGDTFECSACKKVLLDCDTPFHQRPWFPGHDNPYFIPVGLYYAYYSGSPIGLMENPPCNCDDNCLHFEGLNSPNEVAVGAATFFVEFLFADDPDLTESDFCGGELMSILVLGTDMESFDFNVTVRDCQNRIVAGTIINSGDDNEIVIFPPELSRRLSDCDCTIKVEIENAGTGDSAVVELTGQGLASQNCLNIDYNIAVATGPVFYIPIETCQGGIPTDCCNCTPDNISVLAQAGDYSGQVLLEFNPNSGKWVSLEALDFFGCDDSLGEPWQIYCQDDQWVIQTFLHCDDCRPATLCPCIPGEFLATLEWVSPTANGSKMIRFVYVGDEQWMVINDFQFTPDCADPIIFDNLTIDFSTGDITLTPAGAWGFTGGTVSTSSCVPFQGSGTFERTHGSCFNVFFTLSFDVEGCSNCFQDVELTNVFYACDPFEASLSLYSEEIPSPIQIQIYDGYDYCGCGTQAGRSETVALEARVNIPLSCHFKVENGVLSLNLANLLGPGLYIGLNEETNCPYIGGYPGGYNITYRETIIYCCYTTYVEYFPFTPVGLLYSGYTGSGEFLYNEFNYEFNNEFTVGFA